jgi:hypothetical protein
VAPVVAFAVGRYFHDVIGVGAATVAAFAIAVIIIGGIAIAYRRR